MRLLLHRSGLTRRSRSKPATSGKLAQAVYGGAGEGLHDSPGHPGGMPEGSRGLRSALRDDTPGACAATPASRRDARFSAQNTGSGTPPGCDFLPCLNRGYRFARPPATFWHPSRMSLADFSASHLFHRKQRRTSSNQSASRKVRQGRKETGKRRTENKPPDGERRFG